MLLSLSQLGVTDETDFIIQDNNGATVDASRYTITWGSDVVNIQFNDNNIDGTWRLKYYVKTYSNNNSNGDYVSGTWLKLNQSANDRVNFRISTNWYLS